MAKFCQTFSKNITSGAVRFYSRLKVYCASLHGFTFDRWEEMAEVEWEGGEFEMRVM